MTDLRITALGAEVWSANTPPLRISLIGFEAWYSLIPALVVSGIGREVWFDQASLITETPAPRRRRSFFVTS